MKATKTFRRFYKTMSFIKEIKIKGSQRPVKNEFMLDRKSEDYLTSR